MTWRECKIRSSALPRPRVAYLSSFSFAFPWYCFQLFLFVVSFSRRLLHFDFIGSSLCWNSLFSSFLVSGLSFLRLRMFGSPPKRRQALPTPTSRVLFLSGLLDLSFFSFFSPSFVVSWGNGSFLQRAPVVGLAGSSFLFLQVSSPLFLCLRRYFISLSPLLFLRGSESGTG